MGWCMGGVWHGAWVDELVVMWWGWNNCIPGFVMLDLGVGSSLVGGGEGIWCGIRAKVPNFPKGKHIFHSFLVTLCKYKRLTSLDLSGTSQG